MTKANISILITLIGMTINLSAQDKALTNTSKSKYAKLRSVDIDDVHWTGGFWGERFDVCKNTMVPGMWQILNDAEVSHSFRNFEIAAGYFEGTHQGPPFHDGDFYKWFEGLISVYAQNKDHKTEKLMDSIIGVIALSQRDDGYIHSPVTIAQRQHPENKKEFSERLDFETYNMGHLMTAACLHHRATGKTNFLDVARKATDFLYEFYNHASAELARNAICPSHYMGVIEMYRTTGEPKYLELAESLIRIRSLVENGTDHNQDRIPFYEQTKAVGHAVRANYLYAGAADVYLETGNDSILKPLQSIWEDVVTKKMYITGACGALYDGVSPNGTTYDQPSIQQVHQAYGREYELPNITGHNESCANIGNLLWNWRMLQANGNVSHADVMETTLYNSILAAVSLDGTGYFYTNPMSVSHELSHDLRWSKEREAYISYCNCCPPNTVRTVAETHNYAYAVSDKGVYVNLYGSNTLSTKWNGKDINISQTTDYPWNGRIEFELNKVPKEALSLFLRIPSWADKANITVDGKEINFKPVKGEYVELHQKWKKGSKVVLQLPLQPKLMAANPLVEETRNQVAVQYGPVVYCLESADIPKDCSVFDVSIASDVVFTPVKTTINGSTVMVLKGKAKVYPSDTKAGLYFEIPKQGEEIEITLVPYYAWGNRGKGEMTVWLGLDR